ncbi:Holliday junction resolvase RecU [Vagococcus elongatus]|uniref:Holliday junction resolvase RecU n=1 Tax=Vagococcus elongatus TaxID=180344 RepID=A0A430B5U5_9ENTE|nr:Holliday junction resolvase RecU [Vagococcus elongatus]RSU15681.1 Holliday junction resolvase RecU [Vagococcus elongatus]
MTMNYPNGRRYSVSSSSDIKGSKKINTKFSNRGMTFEEMINETNLYYLQRDIAVIHKKPTPIQIVKVDYPKRSAAKIKEAYFKQASTTDYNGVYQGRYLDFEAKETKNKTSFPLANLHDHQVYHMKKCVKQQGIVFVLVWFSTLKRCFLLSSSSVFDFWDKKQNGKKSIPLSFFESDGIEVSIGFAPRVDYLAALEKLTIGGA